MEFETWQKNNRTSPVQDFLDEIPNDLSAWIDNKFDYYDRLDEMDMRKLGFIENIPENDLIESRFKCTPPVRMLYSNRFTKSFLLQAFYKKYDGRIRNKEINIALANLGIFDSNTFNQNINI